jgi:hypothetical protein
MRVEINIKENWITQAAQLRRKSLSVCWSFNSNSEFYFHSRAILAYLANQYGKDDTLYPKDAKKRAIVDQRLYFDIGSLYQGFLNYYVSSKQQKYEPVMRYRPTEHPNSY